MNEEDGYWKANLRLSPFRHQTFTGYDTLATRLTQQFEQYVKLSQNLNADQVLAAIKVDDIGRLADIICAHLVLSIEEKQELIEIFNPVERCKRLADILDVEIEKLHVDRSVQNRVKRQMERAQKEYYLNEKIKAIQQELGKKDEKSELDELRRKIEAAGMPKDAYEKAMQELKRLEMMPPMSAESTVSRNYLDWLLAVPWKKKSREIRDIELAEKILNEDHYGLEKVKERILEFLAVRQLVKKPKGSILCFVGPPGVGKTSLGMSIARATGRKFVRLALGRRARRSRNPRSPPHLHRRSSRTDHSDDQEGRHDQSGLPARRSRQDEHGFPRRSVGRPAGSARSRTELHVPGSLPGCRIRSVAGHVHRHGQRSAHDSAAACRTAWKSCGCPDTPSTKRSRLRAVPGSEADGSQRA